MSGGLANIEQEFKDTEAPQLPLSQQALAETAFKTAVTPLREGFKERLGTTTEQLASKGIAFGGLGGQGFRDVFKEQGRQEAQIAGQIGTQLGQTALDQAFQSSEAAKSRALQKDLQASGFEFQSGESKLERESREKLAERGLQTQVEEAERGREFTREQTLSGQAFEKEESELDRLLAKTQAQLGREFSKEESSLAREFQAGQNTEQRGFASTEAELDRDLQRLESQLGRELTTEENAAMREFNAVQQQNQLEQQERLARLEIDFRGNEAEANRRFEAEQNTLGRTLTREESELQRSFQQELQATDLEFRGTQADIDRQSAKNQQLLNLALEGNIDQEDIPDVIADLLGEGAVLTSHDELTLQNIAAASGLTTDEYKDLRAAIGTKQAATILGTTFRNSDGSIRDAISVRHKFPSPPEKHPESVTAEDSEKMRQLTKSDLRNQPSIQLFDENGLVNKEEVAFLRRWGYTDDQINDAVSEAKIKNRAESNINNFISDPVAAREFALNLANIESRAQRDIAKQQTKKVLCTELHRQGLLCSYIYEADGLQAEKTDRKVVEGYHSWGMPLANLMSRNKFVTYVLSPFIKSWAYQMAYKEGYTKKPNKLGYLLELVGIPICYALGTILSLKKNKRGYVNG